MSNRDVRKLSLQDIQLVQNLIERCLQLYMSQSEVVSTLLQQAKIEPGFTELVWQKLETENQEFFKAYHLRLLVKDQILRFNQLLERQIELMHQMRPIGAPTVPLSNGSQIQQMHVYPNTAATLQSSVTSHTGRIDVPSNTLLAQCSNAVPIQGMNGGIIKSEVVYSGDSSYMFGADNNNLLEPRIAIGEGSVSNFNGVERDSPTLNDTVFDQETNSFGFVGQIPRNFSLSDLTADFSNDILETYSRSPFLGTDANFLDPHVGGEQQDIRRLDTISEGFSYEDFGSD